MPFDAFLKSALLVALTFKSTNAISETAELNPSTGARLETGDISNVEFYMENANDSISQITLNIPDSEVAGLVGRTTFSSNQTMCKARNQSQTTCFDFGFNISGLFLGRSRVIFYRGSNVDDRMVLPIDYTITVLRTTSSLNIVFFYGMAIIVAISNIGFGCTINLEKMRKILTRPFPVFIGLGCQFLINPSLAFGYGKLFSLSVPLALGLFTFGCCPDGGGSNMWTLLLGGDVDLSMLMTLCSNILSFGTIPLWMFLLGNLIAPEDVTIPYANLLISLASLLVPCLIGVALQKVFPKIAAVIRKLFKPIVVVLIICVIPLAVYTNLYAFALLKNWKIIVSSLCLPYSSLITSALFCLIFRQPRDKILVIAIETAIQNSGIAIVMILSSFPAPDGDIAAVMPIAANIFTPIPLYILLIAKVIRNKCGAVNNEMDKDKEQQNTDKVEKNAEQKEQDRSKIEQITEKKEQLTDITEHNSAKMEQNED